MLLDLTLFRDDRLVALHDLVEACRSSARHCLLAAELMPNDPRCEELRALGGKRTATADFFGERMIAEDRSESVGEGKRVSVRVALGGRLLIKTKKNSKHAQT